MLMRVGGAKAAGASEVPADSDAESVLMIGRALALPHAKRFPDASSARERA